MALAGRRAKMALAGFLAINGFTGCGAASSLVREDSRSKDTVALNTNDNANRSMRPNVVRSQAPEVLPPVRIGKPQSDPPGRSVVEDPVDFQQPTAIPVIIKPATNNAPAATPTVTTAAVKPLPSKVTVDDEGDTQVRIVASIGNNPIYESEVREAVYQRLGELLRLGDGERAIKQKEFFREELRKIIERELVLEDMISTLNSRKQTNALNKLKEAAGKEADAMLKSFKKERGVSGDEEFKTILRAQGLTLSGVRRQIERGTMMRIYMQEKVSPRMDSVGLADVREYYEAHGNEFTAEDSVRWMGLYVMYDKFPTPAEAKTYASQLLAQIQKGNEFGPIAAKYGHGDSATRNGIGIGEKPGEIFPPEVEPSVLRLKAGQSAIHEGENGIHVIKVLDRTVAGRKPLDEKLQLEIKRKVQAQIFEREAKRYVDTLWKRVQPQIWIDL